MRILYYGEGPWAGTGLAQVTRNIIDPLLADGHQIEIVATNHPYEVKDESALPYVIHPSGEDCANVEKAVERIHAGGYDAFIYSADFGRYHEAINALFEEQQKRDFWSIIYAPVDCDVMPENSFSILECFNVAITYTKHGQNIIKKSMPDAAINTIYLACEPERFYPLSQEERRQARKDLFSIDDDGYFLVLNVNRNQGRKDMGRGIAIYHEFHKTHPNGKMYLHCQKKDSGGDVSLMAHTFNALDEFIFTPDSFSMYNGFDFPTMNRIYNAADCFFSTSTGEGWGLTTTEAMTASCPVVVPGNTANIEIIGEQEERGYLIKSGGGIDHWTWLYGMVDNPRDTVHASSAISKLEHVYWHRDEAREKAQAARAWCQQNTKEVIGKQWVDLFRTLAQSSPQKEKIA